MLWLGVPQPNVDGLLLGQQAGAAFALVGIGLTSVPG